MELKKVGVMGAGVMGVGVAQNLAQSKKEVILIDISDEILQKALQQIAQNIRFSAFFNKNKESEDAGIIMERIKFNTDYQVLNDVDFIIENVTENWSVKADVYKKLDQICPENSIFAVNTSCISITEIAALTSRKDKVIGIHFMNPVPLKDTVEVVRGFHTSEETITNTNELLKAMGKKSIIVNDLPGFVSNRISHLFMNEAIFVVHDQVASAQQVDEIFKKCYGHSMGPLETADLIGLDTVMDSLNVLYETYQDSKFRCCPLLRKMVAAGLLGKKSGKGFYDY